MNLTPAKFRTLVWRYYRTQGRHDLPWRKSQNLYRVLVSEVMLQQTQVERVILFYTKFMKAFPTAKKLAEAPLSRVLVAWQGLGYNRRAQMLHQAAKRFDLVTRSNLVAQLEKLPGVGPYTARAVAAFAYNEDVVFVETNIRTAIIHHFFSKKTNVTDTAITQILMQCVPKGRSREWYSALMDYGAHLKRSGISHNTRSTTYTKQLKFAGSLREARGAILRELTHGPATTTRLVGLLGPDRASHLRTALEVLVKEKMILKKTTRYTLAD